MSKRHESIALILAERERQILKGYDATHDDEHTDGALAATAAAYAAASTGSGSAHQLVQQLWPFDSVMETNRPRLENLAAAGALIIAEIERVLRADAAAAPAPSRRTKRRFAYELHPHPREMSEIRPLAVEVPYLYAHAIGMNVSETGWSISPEGHHRIQVLVHAQHAALLADALLQGMTGDKAWAWAEEHRDESGELVWDRAVHYGVDPNAIKPYICGPEPTSHYCQLPENPRGLRNFVPGRESECENCTEPLSASEASRG